MKNKGFSLLRNSSIPLVVPHSMVKRSYYRKLRNNSSDEERKSVEKLTEWEKRDTRQETLHSVSEAKITLKKRIDGEDLVEEIKFRRKHKSYLPDINSKKILPVIKSIKQRQSKKEIQETFRERCRYFRLFEEDLHHTYEELMKKLTNIKLKRDLLREECCEIKRSAVIINENYEKLRENLGIYESKGRAKFTQEELTIWMNRREKMREELKQLEKKKIETAVQVKEETDKRAVILEEIDNESKELRKKIGMVKATQTKHYYELLKEGSDTRSEGLKWIVIALWKVGETVTFDHFPKFLDEESSQFLS